MALPKKSEVNRLVQLWKGRLGLQGWDIQWGWVTGEKLVQETGYNAIASTDCNLAEQKAFVDFDQGVQWTTGLFYSDVDLESTVVHELLHIRMEWADSKLDLAIQNLLPLVSPDQVRLFTNLLFKAREEYIETARTLLQEAFQSNG